MPQYGTLSTVDELLTSNELVADFGEANLAARFATALQVHNAAFTEMLSDFALVTGDYLLPYGGADRAIIDELDEWGAADPSKVTGAGNLGLPLRIYGGTIQWTRTYIATHTVGKLTKQLDAFAAADLHKFTLAMRNRLFNPLNSLTYKDRLMTGLTLPLVALLNADGMEIPDGPNGKSFDGATHTHYTATATLTAASQLELIENVIEHGVDGQIRIYISRDDEDAYRALTGFQQYVDPRLTYIGNQIVGSGQLDVNSPDDRAIGTFGGAEIWVKPWMIAEYQMAFDFGGTDPAIGIRTRSGDMTGMAAFAIQAENEQYPLRARNLGREYGLGIVNRHRAAVHHSGDATYVVPTFS